MGSVTCTLIGSFQMSACRPTSFPTSDLREHAHFCLISKNVVKVDILFTGKCKTKLSMCHSLQTSADGSRLPRPGSGQQRVG